MADLTAHVAKPGISGAAPDYTAVTASDVFDAPPNARYILHYQNGATTTGAAKFTVVDATSVAPAGADVAAGWADAETFDGTFGAAAERIVEIPNTNRFRNADGQIGIKHTGTLTTVKVAILGPYPA